MSVDRCDRAASSRFRPVFQLGVVFGVLALGFTAPPTMAAALYLSDHPGATPAVVAGALKTAGNLLWNATGDPDRTKETLLNVDSLIGTTIGIGPRRAR